MKKKNILLDLDVIVKGVFDKSYKTGIFWTEYNILLEMKKNHGEEFNFYGFCDCGEKFLNEKVFKVFPELSWIKYFNIYSTSEYYKKLLAFKIRNLRSSKKSNKNFFAKIFLNTKIIVFKILKLLTLFLPKKHADLSSVDIYQSFFYITPKEIIRNKGIKKFVMVYDVMPITNPEFFVDDENYKTCKDKFINNLIVLDKGVNIITNSKFVMNEFKRELPKFQDSNIIVDFLAADGTQFFKKEESENDKKILIKYNIPTNSKYLLSLCSLNKRKNLAFLVSAFIDFLEENQNIQDLNLVLAGPKGWLIDDMLNNIQNCAKYKDKIILTGFVDEEDKNTIYNKAFTFIFPSLAEGFGLPVLEAMHCGIPVISSNTTSLPEVYGDAAIGISPTDKNDLISAITNFYFDEKLRQKYIEKGLKQTKKFSWEKTVDNMVNEYLK
ncbi:MAG TPA: glycosyltransferase family 1 protein [Rickettsiales bacterium]|nr:glycosyltransferase family 1 protein [Rickettsiales bacterium]